MTPELVLTIGREAMLLAVMLAGPLLLAALVVGLVIGFFQAATQINEMTLTFVPKLIALALVLAIAGPWMLHQMMDYTIALVQHIPAWIG
ncbi:MAG: flagellar biosynthesis protein FliQ [Nevskiaceae bacterium]|nr:MAG: flagellar biosynthesis protein FliQ [Nevskiaceae bacterium]TBR72188.1 MAG: flagellar biosynthesis protein FliQ [Nevskiaceae bacterium]